MKTMLSVDELAARWGVHRQTIYKAIKDKQIIASRVGGRVLVARSHIEYLEQNGNMRSAG
jgi:excisionase family DNA binding protein